MNARLTRFAKINFGVTLWGSLVYLADVGTDLWAATNYFMKEQYLWGILTLVIVLVSSIVIQFFSYTWFKEDNPTIPNQIFLLHLLNGGIFTRYWFALKHGCQAAFKTNKSGDVLIDPRIFRKRTIDAFADISMLRLFKAFLESTPQLILQIYILMTSDSSTFIQYFSITTSFAGISCAIVDYQIALRKSLSGTHTFHGMSSKITYFFYKLLTLISWVLSITLFAVFNFKCFIFLLAILWFGALFWVLEQHTTFCKSKATEMVYRTIVGIILIFTFFNVKGKKTRIPLSVYYVSRVFLTIAIIWACMHCKSVLNEKLHLLLVIIVVVITLIFGLILLIVYYIFFHPSVCYTGDVIDGTKSEEGEACRMIHFLM